MERNGFVLGNVRVNGSAIQIRRGKGEREGRGGRERGKERGKGEKEGRARRREGRERGNGEKGKGEKGKEGGPGERQRRMEEKKMTRYSIVTRLHVLVAIGLYNNRITIATVLYLKLLCLLCCPVRPMVRGEGL